jgi:hypothetical protein
MIGALAGLVPKGAYPDRVRLILLDYPRPLPDYIGDSVLEANLAPVASIVPNDLKPCLRAWDTERARQGKGSWPPRSRSWPSWRPELPGSCR